MRLRRFPLKGATPAVRQSRFRDGPCMELSLNEQFERLMSRVEALVTRIESVLPQPLSAPDWNAAVAYRYRKRSSGHGSLEPVRHLGVMRLDDLKEIDGQKEKIQRNTEQFVSGKPANNVLLTGSRGTGKSSLIRACLNEYAPRGLRLIEVDKADLTDLPDIVDLVGERPEKFIVFSDDLSFDEGEPGYKALKSILDGSVAAAAPNVLIYATSNRRHLLPEYMKENLTYKHSDDGELHPGEVVEEKISLSERFGLWVSFYPFSQDEYLAIVAQWLSSFGVDEAAIVAARPLSLVWALERGSRSGRVAYQFARDFAGRHDGGSRTAAPAGVADYSGADPSESSQDHL
jgi:predicted AAA+ superfamily ATPase